MADNMYRGSGSDFVTIVFDKGNPRKSSAMVHRLRQAYGVGGRKLGLPAIRYLGVDVPDGVDEIGFLFGGNEFISGDRVDDAVVRMKELEANLFEWML